MHGKSGLGWYKLRRSLLRQGGKNLKIKRVNENPFLSQIQGTRPVPVLDEHYLRAMRASPMVKNEPDKVIPTTQGKVENFEHSDRCLRRRDHFQASKVRVFFFD